MATKLKKFEFSKGRPRGAGGSRFDKYLNGEIWRLERGVDYKSDASTGNYLYVLAKRRGKKANVRFVDGGIVIQAFDESNSG